MLCNALVWFSFQAAPMRQQALHFHLVACSPGGLARVGIQVACMRLQHIPFVSSDLVGYEMLQCYARPRGDPHIFLVQMH
jgi:hypothetical protein